MFAGRPGLARTLAKPSEVNRSAPAYSTPVVANGVVYLASNTHLYAFYDAARSAATKDQVPKVELKK